MTALDFIGVAFCAVGIAILGVGYKVLGGMWIWIGLAVIALGSIVLAFSARARIIERRLREYDGPGDAGQRGYSGGASAADMLDSGPGHGGGAAD